MGNDIRSAKPCCSKSTEYSIHSRRCFMTGEYCSKQTNVHMERERLHKKDEINAFVIMNFSNMSDVVYKWRLQSYIESLKKYLFISDGGREIACISDPQNPDCLPKEQEWHPVKKIHVIRADSNSVTNYVICNRVCQQMQIADLIIADVSVENTNVFYEFGMAMAFGKLILPICYSGTFYEHKLPDAMRDNKVLTEKDKKAHEKHISCYPWRKQLFEHYGIRYREMTSTVAYHEFDDVIKEEYHFPDRQYAVFPYDEKVAKNKPPVGKMIYERLKETYNNTIKDANKNKDIQSPKARNGRDKDPYNTVVIYTMDGFLNEEQAGQCIINFFYNMTLQMKLIHCFCGDRVGILGQAEDVFDKPKDTKTGQELFYKLGDIIRIGMNQATFQAQRVKIKSEDFLKVGNIPVTMDKNARQQTSDALAEMKPWNDETIRQVKEYIRNRCIPIYPDNPIFVDLFKNGLQKGILDKSPEDAESFDFDHFFCLFHVMLRTLKFTNEIVVDISNNSLQALFWLGAAHGSDIYAITVQHELTDEEREKSKTRSAKSERPIFDVAGLWTAIFRSHDTEGFYKQLELTQLGIEQRTKLMLKNMDYYESKLWEQFYERADDMASQINKLQKDKAADEKRAMESFYRDRFWRHMLRYNELGIYLPQVDTIVNKIEPRLHVAKWDVDAMSALSHYLSKRKVIGKYHLETLPKDTPRDEAQKQNFISVGDAARPLPRTEREQNEDEHNNASQTVSLAEYVSHRLGGDPDPENSCNVVRQWMSQTIRTCGKKNKKFIYRGFASFNEPQTWGVYAQFPQSGCIGCVAATRKNADRRIVCGPMNWEEECQKYADRKVPCPLKGLQEKNHTQLAQMIMWRSVPADPKKSVKFRVSLNGASGPATLALAGVLVDEDQKREILHIKDGEDDSQMMLLNDLQIRIRKIFLDQFFSDLETDFADLDAQNRYRLRCVTGMYLSTLLYQYFLPFLSRGDEVRICNGLNACLVAMKTTDDADFEWMDQTVIKKATDTLRKRLARFRGIEVMYGVDVQVKTAENDSRQVTGIRELDIEGVPSVSCLFV